MARVTAGFACSGAALTVDRGRARQTSCSRARSARGAGSVSFTRDLTWPGGACGRSRSELSSVCRGNRAGSGALHILCGSTRRRLRCVSRRRAGRCGLHLRARNEDAQCESVFEPSRSVGDGSLAASFGAFGSERTTEEERLTLLVIFGGSKIFSTASLMRSTEGTAGLAVLEVMMRARSHRLQPTGRLHEVPLRRSQSSA